MRHTWGRSTNSSLRRNTKILIIFSSSGIFFGVNFIASMVYNNPLVFVVMRDA